MLSVIQFTFNPFQENTYIIKNELNECWIIDPGMYDTNEVNQVINHLISKDLKVQAIINTHAHLDHIFGVDALVERFNIPFFIHEKELAVLNHAANSAQMFGFNFRGVKTVPQFIKEKEILHLGKDELEIRFVPGHSPGSIAFYNANNNWVISGDALFSGSIGRTDLPGGDYDTLINSIKAQLLNLPPDTIVYSGHGSTTTIGTEKKNNPFLS
jgi:hydroxyacylglutathione hydrolase